MAVSCVSTSAVAMAFLLLLSALLSTGSCGGQVPFVLWSSEGHPVPRQTLPPAGHVVSAAELDSYLSSVLATAPPNTLLFLQDQLSVDDFTVFGGVFGNKEDSAFPHLESELKASSSPLVLPALSWGGSSAVLPLLQQHLGTPPLYLDPSSLAQLRINASDAALLVIRLPYKAGSSPETSRDALFGNDAVIGQVLDIMKVQAVPYTAIYTAFKPSRQVAEDLSESVQSVGRSLLQAPAANLAPLQYTANGTACILLWAESLQVSVFNKTWQRYDLAPETFSASPNVTNPNVTIANSTCGTAQSRLVLNYRNVLGSQRFSLAFIMSRRKYPVSARDWFTLDGVELRYDGQTVFFNGSRHLNAPAEYSYHCASVTSFGDALLEPSDPTEANLWQLSFTDFQIQGFSLSGLRFSYANDCASFFTPGIWMGLIISLLFLLILTYGLHMITQVHTMDRFDDPKGPGISVPQSE